VPVSDPATPLVVGLTGGIASGKSLAADAFKAAGADVIDTDVLAREVVAPGTDGLARIAAEFGAEVLTADGELERNAMRQRVFSDSHARQRLEAITHPLIEAEALDRLARCEAPYAVLVVPLLLERGWQRLTDRVAVVDCQAHQQRERLRERDNASDEAIERTLASQLSREERLAHADDVLVNTGAPEALEAQVLELDRSYRAQAAGIGR